MPSVITTIAGSGEQGYKGDGGSAKVSLMDNPFHVALNNQETELFIADCFNYCVRKLDLKSNIITTVAGIGEKGYSGDGGLAVNARIEEIYAVQVTDNGDLYILQRFSPAIRTVDCKTGIITTVAGNGTVGYSGDGGPAIKANIKTPFRMDFDKEGNLYFSDRDNNRIRKVDASGVITTIAGHSNIGWLQDGLEVRITVHNFP